MISIPIIWVLFQKRVFSTESLLMRFDFWNDIIQQKKFNWMFGGRIGTVGQGSELGWFGPSIGQLLDLFIFDVWPCRPHFGI